MFEKVRQLAERAATSVSRRQFLGGLGRGAMAVAAATAGLLALPGAASAGKGGGGCPAGTKKCSCGKGSSTCCPLSSRGCYAYYSMPSDRPGCYCYY
jgi:hypothetical protein